MLFNQVLQILPDPGSYWNGRAQKLSRQLWMPTYDHHEMRNYHTTLQNTWFSSTKYIQPTGTETKVVFPIREIPTKTKQKKKTKATAARSTHKKESDTINRLSRFAFNTVVGISRRKRVYVKDCKCGPAMLKWLKPMALDKKIRLFSDIKASKDSTYEEDNKLQKSAV
ncbi:unnamed protein product [Rhizophagus irregularis]|nr:unnamed protein product [Rhizophagus irregularis]